MKTRIINFDDSVNELLELSALSGSFDKKHYKKIMLGFIENSLGSNPDLDKGIVYGLWDKGILVASARIKQCEYIPSGASIEYVAVKSNERGRGFGKKFIEDLFKIIKKDWKKSFAILVTGKPKTFYEKLGMEIFGKLINEKGNVRNFMSKKL